MRLPPARVVAETTRGDKVAAVEGRGVLHRASSLSRLAHGGVVVAIPGTDRSGHPHERLIKGRKGHDTRFVRGMTRCHGTRDERDEHEHCAPGASWRENLERQLATRVWLAHEEIKRTSRPVLWPFT